MSTSLSNPPVVAWEKISTVSGTGALTTLTIAIPSGYRTIMLRGVYNQPASGTVVATVNGNAMTGQYQFSKAAAMTSGAGSIFVVADGVTGARVSFTGYFTNYTDTFKSYVCSFGSDLITGVTGATWNNNAEITTIVLTTSAGVFAATDHVDVYGGK